MDDVGWLILLICILAAATLFFSASAIALRIFSPVKLREAFKACGRADMTEELAINCEKLVLSCNLYRLITNICILLMVLGVFAVRRGGNIKWADYVLTLVVAGAIFSVFSLAIPHAWAKYSGEKLLMHTYKLLMLLAYVAWPVLIVLKVYDGFVRRLAGVAEATPEEAQEEKEEEFLNGLEQRKMEGVVDEEEQQMIESVLELSETTAAEIMTPRTDIVAVGADADLQSVLTTIKDAGHSRIPVYQNNIDNIIGVIYAKDLLTEVGKEPGDFNVRQKMREAYFVPETKPLRVLLHEFQNQKLHIAILLDEYGGTAGIVTIEDILEELVGEIADEYEEAPAETVRKLNETTIEVDARIRIDDLNKEFDLQLPEDEDYDTVGGFVFSHLGYIPKTGETFEYENLKFVISAAETRKIKTLRIQKILHPGSEEAN